MSSTDCLVLNYKLNEILTAEANFVATIPGATQFTLILSWTTSLAIAFVNPRSVVLLTL